MNGADDKTKTFYYRVISNVYPAGSGTVALSTSRITPSSGSAPLDTLVGITVSADKESQHQQFYLYGLAANGYHIDHFMYSGYPESTGNDNYIAFTLQSASEDPENPATYLIDACFEPYTVFLGEENSQFGRTYINNVYNQIGDTVTLTARPYAGGLIGAKFLGWIGPDGSAASTDNPYSFVVTDQNKGRYYADYSGRDVKNGFYCMITNRSNDGDGFFNEAYGRSLGLFGTADSLGLFNLYPVNSLMLASGDTAHSSPAFVIKVTGEGIDDGSLVNASFSSQGVPFIGNADGKVSTISIASYDNFRNYQIYGNFGPYFSSYVADDNSKTTTIENLGEVHVPYLSLSTISANDRRGQWQFDEFSATDDSLAYFGAKPSESSKIGGRYYTTMYTAFPYQCLDSVIAYTVSAINDDGSVQLDVVESDTIPAYTPVILSCKSVNPKENRLLPLADEQPPLFSTNLLKGEIWLKDYTLPESSYRTAFDPQTMRVLSADGSKFVNVNNTGILSDGTTGQLPFIVNNTAYLDISAISNPRDSYTLFKETVTGISEELRVKNEESNSKAIYSITGQYLGTDINKLPKGIYIRNKTKITIR